MLDQDLLPEFECERRFGRESFSFFNPIEVGENFVANVWTRGPLEERDLCWKTDRITSTLNLRRPIKYAINIYENGTQISVRDGRFLGLPWAMKLQKSWSDEIFSREEIETILADLTTIQSWEEVFSIFIEGRLQEWPLWRNRLQSLVQKIEGRKSAFQYKNVPEILLIFIHIYSYRPLYFNFLRQITITLIKGVFSKRNLQKIFSVLWNKCALCQEEANWHHSDSSNSYKERNQQLVDL